MYQNNNTTRNIILNTSVQNKQLISLLSCSLFGKAIWFSFPQAIRYWMNEQYQHNNPTRNYIFYRIWRQGILVDIEEIRWTGGILETFFREFFPQARIMKKKNKKIRNKKIKTASLTRNFIIYWTTTKDKNVARSFFFHFQYVFLTICNWYRELK